MRRPRRSTNGGGRSYGDCALNDGGDALMTTRLDRVLDVPEEGIRREGAILAREIFDVVATRLRADHSWR